MRTKPFIAAVATIGVIAGGGLLLVRSGATEVAEVRVQGLQLLDPVAMRRASGITPGMSAISLDLEAAAARLERIPLVESASVQREGALGIVITIVERRPAAILATPMGRRAVDRDAVTMDLPPAPVTLPVLQVEDLRSIEPSTVRAFLRLWDRLTVGERRKAGVSWGIVHGLTVTTGPTTLIIGAGDELDAKLSAFREIRHVLGRAPRRVDLTQLPRIGVVA